MVVGRRVSRRAADRRRRSSSAVALRSTSNAVDPDRVMVGEPAGAVLTAAQPGTAAARGRSSSTNTSAARSCPVTVPALAPGGEHTTSTNCRPTAGPSVQRRPGRGRPRRPARAAAPPASATPRRPRCGSTRGGRSSTPLPSGFAKDLEGPTSDASPAGDIAFHALRPYQLGDDRRHIHWMSTARIRHAHGPPLRRQPPAHARRAARRRRSRRTTTSSFEIAVEIVTSLLVSSAAGTAAAGHRPHHDGVVGRAPPTRRSRLRCSST